MITTRPNRSALVGISSLLVLLAVTGNEGRSAPPSRLRNVVLFVADDMGQDAGCYGNPVIKTPHLDALARSGTRFSDAFCTTSSCSPSRSVILTGLHSHATGQYGLAHGVHNFYSREEVKTLPVLMRQAGYRTARFGRATHVRPYELYAFDVAIPEPGAELTMEARLYGRDIVRCVDDAGQFIARADAQPFFVMVATNDAHRFGTRFDALPGQPNTFANDHTYAGVTELRYTPAQVLVPRFLNDNLGTRAELAQYYQSISRLDQGLGRLMEILKRTGHWEDTLIIFISDNGAPFPGAKTNVYEPGLRVPCVIRDPAAPRKGLVSDAMISWVDITPTILDYAGALRPNLKLHGRSILPVLQREHAPEWGEVYASHTFHEVTSYYPMRALRERRYKLIWNAVYKLDFPIADDLGNSATWQSAAGMEPDQLLGRRTLANFLQRPPLELYDLQEDPEEAHNLAAAPEQRERLERMAARLKEFLRQTRDPWLNKWTGP